MSTKHTPEPWDAEGEYVFAANGEEVHLYSERRKIAACVNALAGIPDPAKALEEARKALAPFAKLAAKHWGAETTVTIGMKEYEAALQALCFLTPSQEQKEV